MKGIPGVKDSPRYWPLKFLFEFMIEYKRARDELDAQLGAEDQTSAELTAAKNRLERQIAGMKNMVKRYFDKMEHHPLHPIDRIDLHAMREAFQLNFVQLSNAVQIGVPSWHMMMDMFQEGSDKALMIGENFHMLSSHALSHRVKAFDEAGVCLLFTELVELQEAGLLPFIRLDRDDPQYDANIERLLQAQGGPFEIDMSRLSAMFVYMVLIVSDAEELPALLDTPSGCPGMMPMRICPSLYLLFKRKKWASLKLLLPALPHWSSEELDKMLLQLCLSGFHTEEILRVVFGDECIDGIVSLIQGESSFPDPAEMGEHFLPLVFALTKTPEVSFEERLAGYLKETRIEPPPKCLMMAYLQGYSVNFLRLVWDLSTAVNSLKFANALMWSRIGFWKVSGSQPSIRMCTDAPITNRDFLLKDGAINVAEVALFHDLFRPQTVSRLCVRAVLVFDECFPG